MKIAIVIGHNSRSQGAVRVVDGVSEYIWNGDLADRIRALDPAHVRIFRRTSGSGEINRAYREVSAWGAAAAVELHFNAFSDPSANGCVTLYGRSPRSKAFAQIMQDEILDVLDNRDRGLLDRTSGRGSLTVNQQAQPTVLIEPYFGSNPGECRLADARKDDLARAVLNGARRFLGQPPIAEGPPPPAPGPEPDDELERVQDALQEIGDLAVSTLATGWAPDLPLEVQRARWTLAAIRNLVNGD